MTLHNARIALAAYFSYLYEFYNAKDSVIVKACQSVTLFLLCPVYFFNLSGHRNKGQLISFNRNSCFD